MIAGGPSTYVACSNTTTLRPRSRSFHTVYAGQDAGQERGPWHPASVATAVCYPDVHREPCAAGAPGFSPGGARGFSPGRRRRQALGDRTPFQQSPGRGAGNYPRLCRGLATTTTPIPGLDAMSLAGHHNQRPGLNTTAPAGAKANRARSPKPLCTRERAGAFVRRGRRVKWWGILNTVGDRRDRRGHKSRRTSG